MSATDITGSIFYLANTGFPYPALPYATGVGHTDEPELTLTAITADGCSWEAEAGDLVFVQNTSGAATKGVKLKAYSNKRGRIGNLADGSVEHEVPISGFSLLGPIALDGWTSGGVALVQPGAGDEASIKVAVIRPRPGGR